MKTRIVVAGGGPAGLAAACLMATEGVDTVVIAPPAPIDPRTVAIMIPALRLLEYVGVWPGALMEKAARLARLRIVDDTGALIPAPDMTFNATDLGQNAFGWNVPLEALVAALKTRAEALGVRIFADRAAHATCGMSGITVATETGEPIEAALCIAADGASSGMRTAAGIETDQWAYDQSALATSFAHSAPHDDESTEYYKKAGPMTTVPMPGGRSGLVWMGRPQMIDALALLPDEDLAAEIQAETHGELGRICDVGPRKVIGMKGLIARRFAARRVLLIGEAAHVVPPIGAQGLNMSLRDAALAADLILAAPDDPGSDRVVASYDAKRRHEVLPRQALIDVMNRSLLAGFMPIESARSAGIWAMHGLGPLRTEVMRLGLADDGALPFAMRV
jgi:2-octaprenyl-6-methoxyphenol hydroxylase